MSKKGIDVSKHQGNIDWKKVKNAGIEFAILRIGYGMYENQKDSKFETNYTNARANSIPVGVYTYSYAKSVAEAEKEADCVIKWLNGRHLDLPVYFDLEDSSQANLGKSTLNEMCKAFCNKIEKAGYWAGIYTNKDWAVNKIDGAELGKRYTYWIAQYNKECTYNGSYAIWQYSSTGKVDGISGNVDMNKMVSEVGGLKKSSTTTLIDKTGDITYQSYDNVKKKWLPEVVNDEDYAGNLDNAMGGLRAKPIYGEITIQTHVKGGKWLSKISSKAYSKNSNNGDSYSGIIEKPIDGIKIWSTKGYVDYRVHIKGSKWLEWVNSKNSSGSGSNSYAGIIGKEIDAIQMK